MNEDAQKKYRVAHGVWTSKSRIASDMERAAATFKAGDEAWKVRTAAARKEAKEAKEAVETAYAVQKDAPVRRQRRAADELPESDVLYGESPDY